jgi:micrococcal nuclease
VTNSKGGPDGPRSVLIGLLLLTLPAACATGVQELPPSIGARTSARVVDVIDGDTIRVLADGREVTVRLIGIDTPEEDGPYTELECYGREATDHTTGRLDGADVDLEYDVERTDRYERTLAYVWLEGELVNESILAQGAGVLLTIPPNVAYVERFERAQRSAREAGRGLWGACAR